MNFTDLKDQEKIELARLMFQPLSSHLEIKNWAKFFLGLEIPHEITDPDSTSSPLDAIWQIYNTFKTNSGNVNPGYILMSARESLKTVGCAILETLLLLHFQLDVGHAAATEEQSSIALGYIEGFLLKVEPLILAGGWINMTQNKRLFKFKTPQQKQPFIKIVICSTKGMNSLHSNVLFLDELDLADPKALKEGKYITGFSKGIYGVKVYLSTRKYAFGNMSQAIENAPAMNYKILNWNVLDVTESCPPERHLPQGPKQDMYVAKNMPLQRITPEEHALLPEVEHPKWDLIKDVHEGCAKCPLLPVCRMRLSKKPTTASGGFYKPISSVIQAFLENDPDSSEAQLMCFGGNTSILMGDGTVKPIRAVAVGDAVITHKGLVRQVTKIFKRPYEGSVLTIKNHAWKHFEPTVVTPEHPYFVNGLEFKSASDIKISTWKKDWFESVEKGDYLSFPTNYESIVNEVSFNQVSDVPYDEQYGKVRIKGSTGQWIPKTFRLGYDFGWITGYFLAEGFYSRDSRRGSKCSPLKAITFCSDERETKYHDRVRSFATELELTTSEFKCKNSHGYTVDIYNTTLSEFFHGMCGEYSDNKKLHSLLINGNIEFLQGILEGFDAGDGTKRRNSYRELTTCSPHLASQLFLIAGRLGLCPRITKKPAPQNGRKQPYLVHYIDSTYVAKQKRTRFSAQNGYNQYRVDDVTNAYFEGFVYNIEVEGDHSYIADGVAVHNCWRPGSTGLVYPRFSQTKGNVITVKQAFETLFGPTEKAINGLTLLYAMQNLGILFYAGVDWGYTHDTTILIVAMIPNGEVWLMETYASPGLEFEDILEIAKSFRNKYHVHKWYVDQNMPSNIKSFRKNAMPCPKFTKDVMGGIEAVRSKIMSSNGIRKFKIIMNETNKKTIMAMTKHRFILDGQGNVTLTPDDARGIADICDSLRYLGQNLFPVKGPQKPEHVWMDAQGQKLDPNDPEARRQAESASQHAHQMMEEITKRAGGEQSAFGTGKKGGFFYTM
jgi:hypothetical protein